MTTAIAVVCACAALAPAADASLSVPTGGPAVTFSGSGTTAASTAMSSFEAAAGGADNGTAAGEQGRGFRHVSWDGIALDGSDPGSTVIERGHVAAVAPSRLESWGLELGPTIAVANDGFNSVNSKAAFVPFSAPNVWAPFNSNTATLEIVSPSGQTSTPVPAQTRGLGIVFLNVKPAGTTTITYYNDQAVLGSVNAPNGTVSFAGLLFPNAVVTRVVVTLGTATIFDFTDGQPSPGGQDGPSSNIVAADDVVLAEPAPARPAVGGTAGVPVSTVLDTFTETSPSTPADFTTTIDWGDGTRSPGTVAPGSGGTFVLTGSHTYTQSGSYIALATVDDHSGSEQTSQTVIQVGPRASTTTVSCTPSPVAVTAVTMCTATVADAGSGGPIAPTGLVAFSSPTTGAGFGDDSGCMLGPDGTPGVSTCEVEFTPSQKPPNQARIAAEYGGDAAHTASAGNAVVAVRAQRCSLKALAVKLNRRPPGLGVVVTCDARANVQITVAAVAKRKGLFRAFRIQFGSLKTSVGTGRPTVLVIKPAPGVVALLRTATRRHQHVSLKLTLVASSHATRATTTTRVSAVRVR